MNFVLIMLLTGLFSLSGADGNMVPENSCNALGNLVVNRVEGIQQIQQAEFDFIQEFKTLNVIGVQKATFYGCGAGNGYLIVETHRQPEVFHNVPRDLWENWKIAYNIDYFYQQVLRNNSLYMVL